MTIPDLSLQTRREISFERLTPLEQAIALPFPSPRHRPSPSAACTAASARRALEVALADPVVAPHCYVLFSGGRDSSGLLALATHVARRLGADDPIPVIVRHRHAPLADEASWQSLVLDHLGLHNSIILDFDGEQSLLSDAATTSLRRNGLIWPAAIQLHGAIYRNLEPGSVISGEGGDMMVSGRRITPLASAVTAANWRLAARLAPSTLWPGRLGRTRRELRAAIRKTAPWLRTEPTNALIEAMSSLRREHLSWRRAVTMLALSRTARVGSQNFLAMARTFGLAPVNPFESLEFAEALAREGRFGGLGDRTTLMRRLFGDLLPDVVNARTTKAAFNETRWTRREREFARDWNGAGVDPRYIDADRLRETWLADKPSAFSDLHLHAAWLAHNRLPAVP